MIAKFSNGKTLNISNVVNRLEEPDGRLTLQITIQNPTDKFEDLVKMVPPSGDINITDVDNNTDETYSGYSLVDASNQLSAAFKLVEFRFIKQ